MLKAVTPGSRLGSGTEGWVLTRYLRRSPTAKLRLPELEQKLQESEAERARLTNELNELKNAVARWSARWASCSPPIRRSQQQLDRITRLSSSTIEVDQQNTQLKQRLAEAEQQIESLEVENRQLASRANREWFLIGGAVLVAGLLLGIDSPAHQLAQEIVVERFLNMHQRGQSMLWPARCSQVSITLSGFRDMLSMP